MLAGPKNTSMNVKNKYRASVALERLNEIQALQMQQHFNMLKEMAFVVISFSFFLFINTQPSRQDECGDQFSALNQMQ